MLEQRQHLLLNYFKTMSVIPAGNRIQASRTADWHLTSYSKQKAVLDLDSFQNAEYGFVKPSLPAYFDNIVHSPTNTTSFVTHAGTTVTHVTQEHFLK